MTLTMNCAQVLYKPFRKKKEYIVRLHFNYKTKNAKNCKFLELRITEETTRLDNVVFNPDAIIEKPTSRNRKGNSMGGCCGGQNPSKN